MKMRLGKPALNNFKVYVYVYRKTLHWEQINWICDIWITGWPIQNLLHIYKVEQAAIIPRLLFTFIAHKLQEHLLGTFMLS